MGRIKSFHKRLFFLSQCSECLYLKACAIVRGLPSMACDNHDLSTDTNEQLDMVLREQFKIMSRIWICGMYYHPAVNIENENTQLLREHVYRVFKNQVPWRQPPGVGPRWTVCVNSLPLPGPLLSSSLQGCDAASLQNPLCSHSLNYTFHAGKTFSSEKICRR